MRLPRACLTCGRPTTSSRCPACTAARKGTAASRGYDRQWRRVRLEVLARDGCRCHWCGEYADTVDHVVPLAVGGARLDPRNLVAACGRCNFGRRP